ncbi:MAG: helix-turn-helix domain-containing protein [Candidatus Aenigmarchaeota archaeon]|nr:helix-turn-helix domain-containing protein [Candidatus Aenigmarchaeota archaeon]
MEIREEVISILEEAQYDYSEYSGCFDVVGRKKRDMVLLKLLGNVDSLQFSQANNLKILSTTLSATALVIGQRTRRETLENGVIYDRFEIPTVTPKTLENILVFRELPFLYRFRGGFFVKVNAEKLREGRAKEKLTQRALADKAQITKKSVYEHERSTANTEYTTAQKMEKALGASIMEHFSLSDFQLNVKPNDAKNAFEMHVSRDMNKLGFETELVYQTPFNIIARERFIVLSEAGDNEYLEKNESGLLRFSKTAKMPVLAVTKEETSLDVPSIKEKELRELSSARELRKLLKRG